MKILFILGAYKPRASANGLCSSKIIDCLKNQGHSVTVLANRNIGCAPYTVEDGIEVCRVKQRVYLRLKEYAEVFAKKWPIRCRIISFIALLWNKVQLVLTSPFWPLISHQTNKRFEKTAKKLQRDNNFDVVISVYTPIEALLAGYEVKKAYPQVLFIPYFLDSLSGGYGPKIFSEQKIINRGLRLEKNIFDAADVIVVMKSSEEHHRKYNHRYSAKMKFLDIPMLVEPNHKVTDNSFAEAEQYRLLFVGSILRNIRTPKTLIDALLCIDREDIVCEFVGNVDCIEDFSALKEKMGSRLMFSGYMDHDQLTEKISAAHILVNIGNRLSTMVPSKIFEYMSFSKPIISTYDIDDEPSVKYLSRYPAALLLSGQAKPEDNALAISEFIQNVRNMEVDFDVTKKQFYSNTPEAFGEVMDELLKGM